jgi:hypothetical protein
MQWRHRIIFLAAITLCIAACKNKKEIHSARHSVYDTDFAVVFSAALDATRELYTNVDDFPGTGMIKTAWHQVSYANNQDDLANQRTVAQGQGVPPGGTSQGAAAAGMPTRLAYKRHFIRFDVSVLGGRPWRVKVIGHAAEWDPGNAMPTELRGASRPPWLDGRIEALQVAIYRRIKAFAVPMKDEVDVTAEPEVPKTDPSTFKGVPGPAASRLAAIKDALARRDYTNLRTQLADDVVWSLGGAPGADTAMAMWQADPESLEAMATVIAGGCGGSPTRVACPAGEPVSGAWQLILEPRGDAWKVTSFLKAE